MNWQHAAINNQQITNSRFLLLDSWREIKTQLSCRLVWHFVYSISRIMYHQCIIFLSSRNSKSKFLFEQPVIFNPSSLKPDNLKEIFSIHPLLLIPFRVSSSLETLPKTISTKPTGNTIKVLLHTLKNNELSIPLLFLLSFYLSIYSFLCFFYFIFSHWLFFCPVLPPTVSSTAASPTIVVAKLKTGITFFVNVAHKNWI